MFKSKLAALKNKKICLTAFDFLKKCKGWNSYSLEITEKISKIESLDSKILVLQKENKEPENYHYYSKIPQLRPLLMVNLTLKKFVKLQ